MTSRDPKTKYPLHFLVWHNNSEELHSLLATKQHDLELVDPHGRTALHLATSLGHIESVRVLLNHGANANTENKNYWTVVQEAVCTGDPMLLQLCLQHRDNQRRTERTEGVQGLLQKLREAPDFYVEMKWEFTSWVPLVSRMCPSDTYRVWKSGSNVRIDTTLLGFDNTSWRRGNRSFIFKGDESTATVMEVDHDARQVYSDVIRVEAPPVNPVCPSEDAVAVRLTAPVITTYIDTEKIAFERSKSGLWGWRSDRAETVNGYQCKVFSASNVELVTKTRTEHLTDFDKQQSKKSGKSPLESILGVAEKEEKVQGATSNGELVLLSNNNPCNISMEDYFDEAMDLNGRDIGRPIEQTKKTQKFKAQLWLAEQYPLSLQEQVLPIIDLMAANNAHFKKLKDFITLQLPAGFPVKIEIPLFHVLNARITFGNIFGADQEAGFLTTVKEEDRLTCLVDRQCFECPHGYSVMGDLRQERLTDEDDALLQFAIQQSLLEAGTENEKVTLWEALDKTKSSVPRAVTSSSEEEHLLQRAIEESLRLSGDAGSGEVLDSREQPLGSMWGQETGPGAESNEMLVALELSRREEDEARRRQKEEEDMLQRVLALSLTEQ